MARAAGSSTERGYGHRHRMIKAAAAAMYRPGQPCTECGQPLTGPASDHDLAHDHVNGGYKGLAHASCNRGDGARRGNHGTRLILSAVDRSPVCSACGVKYHYAARMCAICGTHYHPSGGSVRTCSRACGVQLRRQLYGHAGPRLKAKPKPKPKPKPRKLTIPKARADAVTPVKAQEARRWMAAMDGLRKCPSCGQMAKFFRWCDDCRCTSLNTKSKRCGNLALGSGKCADHGGNSSRDW